MPRFFNPESTSAPNASYSHGVEIPPNARLVFVAGQIPVRPDGSTPQTIEEQTEVVWTNIKAVLAAAGMGIRDIVKITSFLTRYENFARFAQVRAGFLDGHRPASTSVIISALAKPEFLVEVEAIAAKVAGVAKPARRAAKRAVRPAAKPKKRARR